MSIQPSDKNGAKRNVHITVSPEELVGFEAGAFQALRAEFELPGFRRGRVPEDIARKHISHERVFAEAVERAVAKKGAEQIADVDDIVGRPEVTILKVAPGNPLEFRLSFEVVPELKLESWRTMRIKRQEPVVKEEDIGRALEEIKKSHVKHNRVARAAQKGDSVEIDFETKIDGKDVPGGSSKNHPVTLGEGAFVSGFEEAIENMAEGEEKNVQLTFPASWPQKELAGKKGDFVIKLKEVRERISPDLNDEFARSIGRFSNLDDLRQSVREGLLEEKREAERRRVRAEAVDRLGKELRDGEIPEVLIVQEVERMKDELRQSIERHGMAFEEYLTRLGKREEEFAKDWREGAVKRVKAALVLRAVAKKEKIKVPAEEVEERAQQILKQFQQAALGGKVDPAAVRSYTEGVLRNEKTLDLIEEVVTSNPNFKVYGDK